MGILFDPIAWVCWGILFFCLEYALISGVGFLFLGASALAVSAVLGAGFDLNEGQIWILFFTVFFVCILTLLRPLRRRYGKDKYIVSYHKGERAEVVSGPITKTAVGAIKVRNSSRIRAILSSTESLDAVYVGDIVQIVRVDGRLVSIVSCDE